MSRRRRRDMRDDVEGLLFAMVMADLIDSGLMRDNLEGPEIVGVRIEEDEEGVGFEPIIFDEKLIDAPRKSNKLESKK